MVQRLFVVTGGPGSGKTTLCEALANQGISIIAESGRAIIREQVVCGGTALPWHDPQAFASAMMTRDLEQYQAALQRNCCCLFDRGFPDIAGYLTMLGRDVPSGLDRLCRTQRFDEPVFVAPPWPAIYAQDKERKQDWDEAVRTYHAVIAAYHHYGYATIELPLVPVAQRADFMLEMIGAGRG
jgi:predicted ATPase